MTIEGKRKFRRGKRYIDCARLDSKLRRTDRHELMQLSDDIDVDDFDAMFGQMIDDGHVKRQLIEYGEIITFDDGVLFWTSEGCCCFYDEFEFENDKQLKATAA